MSGVKGIKPLGKVIIMLVLAVVFGVAYWFGVKPLLEESQKEVGETPTVVAEGGKANPSVQKKVASSGAGNTATSVVKKKSGPTVVCLSEWPGHMAGPIACGGRTTQPGSFCSKVTSSFGGEPGIDIEFKFIEDPVTKRTSLEDYTCDAVWQTIDEMPLNLPAMSQNKLPQAFTQIDWSNGGDALVFSNKVKEPRDLLRDDVRIAGMKYTPDHTLFEYWITNSDLTKGELRAIRDKVKYSLDRPDFAQKLFCNGEVDVAFLWEPDVTNALTCTRPDGTKGRRAFSTKQADTLIADVLLAMPDTIANRPADLEKITRIFMKGGELGRENPQEAARIVSNTSPRLRGLGTTKLVKAFSWVKWNTLGDNVAMFALDGRDTAQFDDVYNNASEIWRQYKDNGKPVIDKTYLPHTLRTDVILAPIYEEASKQAKDLAKVKGKKAAPILPEPVKYDPEVAKTATPILVKPVEINFVSGSSTLDTRSRSILRTKVLPQLNLARSMSIRIEGNTDDVGNDHANKLLSQRRAEAVKQYLNQQGVHADRVVAKGNGESGGANGPVCKEKTEECRAKRRRTDILFLSGN